MELLNVPDDLLSMFVEEAALRGFETVTLPLVGQLVQTAFAASLQSNEHDPCLFRLALAPPETAVMIRLKSGLPLDSTTVRKLAAGAREQAAIGVWPSASGVLEVWGIARRLASAHAVVDALGPGHLKVGFLTEPLVVIEPSGSVFLGSQGASSLSLIAELFKSDQPDVRRRLAMVSALKGILRRMCFLGHGGTLVVLGRESRDWERWFSSWGARAEPPTSQLSTRLESLLNEAHPLRGSPAYEEVRNAERRDIEDLEQAYAELTVMDGAVVLDADLRLVGAGAKISADGTFELSCIQPSQPDVNRCNLTDLGGTRHQSAARLVFAEKQCVAFVVSADGPLTAFAPLTDGGIVGIRRLDWTL
jgi:hypothetical protein